MGQGLILALALGCGTSKPLPPPPKAIDAKTDVLVVLLDTVRADRMSLYGYGVQTTPRLDALDHAVVFEQNQANCSWTRPSMGSILTGRMPRELGLYEEEFDRLPDDVDLLSERFAASGWTTLGVTSNPNLNTAFGFDQGFEAYQNAGVEFGWMEGKGEKLRRDQPLDEAKAVTDRALALVDAHAGEGPLYLQVVYIDPHWPYVQPPSHLEAVSGSNKPGYDGGIHYIDTQLQRLRDGLAERGRHNVLMVLTADHGEGLDSHPGIPNSAGHGHTLYDSVLHVPLMFHHPSLTPRRIPGLVENLDVARTTLDLVGIPSTGFGGQTLKESVQDGAAPGPHVVIAESDFRHGDKLSIRDSTHTLIRNDDAILLRRGQHEGKQLPKAVRAQLQALPNVEFYPSGALEQVKNRAVDPVRQAEMMKTLTTWEDRTMRRPPINRRAGDGMTENGTFFENPGTTAEPDANTKNALKALGYLE